MKFIAVIDYDLVDKEFNTVCIKDKDGNLHDIDAKPLTTHMIVLDNGQVVRSHELTPNVLRKIMDLKPIQSEETSTRGEK